MSVLLYGRVSTGDQAERDLSIPAQFRALRRLAVDHGWAIAGEYQDVASGRSMRGRLGLVSMVRHAERDRLVEAVLVHRVDRLARNTFSYLTLKTRLRRAGVRIVSYVEHFDSNPMGEFTEHLMAAQAEFYSANLSLEVKKGLEERLRRGKWTGAAPLGYLHERGRIVLDPARSPLVRTIFERWATGEATGDEIVADVRAKGLLSRSGQIVTASRIYHILKNPFYRGTLRVNGVDYPGIHPPLVSPELWARCQEIFRQKGYRGRPHRKLTFLLSEKLVCPGCGGGMVGEEHRKPSGRLFRYYRCHRTGCGKAAHADMLDGQVVEALLALDLPGRAVPILRRCIREARLRENGERAARLRALYQDEAKLDDRFKQLARSYLDNRLGWDDLHAEDEEIKSAKHVIAQLVAEEEHGGTATRGDRALLDTMLRFEGALRGADPIERRRVVDKVVARVTILDARPRVELAPPWGTQVGSAHSELDRMTVSKSTSPARP